VSKLNKKKYLKKRVRQLETQSKRDGLRNKNIRQQLELANAAAKLAGVSGDYSVVVERLYLALCHSESHIQFK